MSTTVYSQVLIYTAESTGTTMERTKMPNLRNGSKGGFEPGLTRLRVRHSTTELPRSIFDCCVFFLTMCVCVVCVFRDRAAGRASKAFLTKDLCGQQYLCYVVPYRHHVRCLSFSTVTDIHIFSHKIALLCDYLASYGFHMLYLWS